jgi:4-amino-4-deoxy-L-arabinose transferase-like glycosyltransferase
MPGPWWTRKENQRWVLGGGALLYAVLVLLPFLGTYGLWDPQEIAVADLAQKVAKGMGFVELWHKQPPLMPWLIGQSIGIFGPSELSARLPVALLGLVAAAATLGIGARLGRLRGGAIAAVVLLSSPLFVFQARQLVSDLGALAATTVALLGLCGLGWPDPKRPAWQGAADIALVAVGLGLGLVASGSFLGVCVPLAAAAIASAGFGPSRRFAIGAGAAALAALGVSFLLVFHTDAAQPGARALFGRMLVAAKDYLPWLGGTWRRGEAPMASVGFDNIVNQVAFGMFPWSALAPVAVLRLAAPRERDRAAWGGVLILAWAMVAYVAATLWWRGVGEVRYAALPAIALALGLFIDDLLAAKLEGDEARVPDAAAGQRVAATFVLLAAVILALDTNNFPDTLPSIHLLGPAVAFPRPLRALEGVILAAGFAFGGLAAAGLFVASGPEPVLGQPRARWIRVGLVGATAAGGVFGLFLSLILVPTLSQHFSYKNLFEAYAEHRRGDEPVGVMGIPGSGPEFYARGQLTRLESTAQLLTFLHRPDRVFAIAPRDKLCEVHQVAASQPTPFAILDNKNTRFNLYTNRLDAGEKDANPLLTTFRKEAPTSVKHPLSATFEDTLELIGVDLPERAGHGDTIQVTVWLRVKKRPTANYKAFLHFDGPGVRFQGDHDQPGVCPTTSWQPGDIIADTTDVVAGELTHPRGTYTLWLGFFTGGNGVYKNMKVSAGEHDPNDRVNAGTIRVE